MTVADARAALVERIESSVAVEVAGFRAAYRDLARENVTAAIDDLIAACKQQGAHDESARLAEIGRKLVEDVTYYPKAGGHA